MKFCIQPSLHCTSIQCIRIQNIDLYSAISPLVKQSTETALHKVTRDTVS